MVWNYCTVCANLYTPGAPFENLVNCSCTSGSWASQIIYSIELSPHKLLYKQDYIGHRPTITLYDAFTQIVSEKIVTKITVILVDTKKKTRSTKVLNPRRKYSISCVLRQCACAEIGHASRVAVYLVLSVLAPTWARGISRHSFGQG